MPTSESIALLQRLFLQASSLAILNQHLESFLQKLGIQFFSFTYYGQYVNSAYPLQYEYASPSFRPWHEHYQAEHYEDADRNFDITQQSTLPMLWVIREQLLHAKSEKERQMRLDSLAFGIERGLSIPLHTPNGAHAIFLVAEGRNENCLSAWESLQYTLLPVAHLYCHHVTRLLLKTLEVERNLPITSREQQCLMLIFKRFSMEAIAAQLCITPRTVNYHIQKVNKKLGVKNKHQAAAKARELGLINA